MLISQVSSYILILKPLTYLIFSIVLFLFVLSIVGGKSFPFYTVPSCLWDFSDLYCLGLQIQDIPFFLLPFTYLQRLKHAFFTLYINLSTFYLNYFGICLCANFLDLLSYSQNFEN